MEIKRYNQLNEGKHMDYYEAFDQFIRGQIVNDYISVPPFGDKNTPDVANRFYGDGIVLENGYKLLQYGGGCSGEDCNTSFIVDDQDELIARNNW